MTEEVNVGMGAPAPKKGMSKGCLVAIIVAGVLLVLVVASFFVCMSKKDDIVKFGVTTLLTSSKQIVVESNIEGIDTAYYNMVIDNFNVRLQADTINLEEIANIFTNIQTTVQGGKMELSDAESILEALITKYPDIVPISEATEMIDSIQTEPEY